MYIDSNCSGCGLCVEKCSFNAITLINSKAVLNKALCRDCGICIDICPTGAIKRGEIPTRAPAKQTNHSTLANTGTSSNPIHSRLWDMICLKRLAIRAGRGIRNKRGLASGRKYGRRKFYGSSGGGCGRNTGRNKRNR